MSLMYLRIAFRSFLRGKAYTAINITGLSLGIACSIVVLLFVRHETSFDAFHPNADRVVRLVADVRSPDGSDRRMPYVMGTLGPAMAAGMTDVESFVRCRDQFGTGRFSVGVEGKKFYVGDYLIVEPGFLTMFDFPLISGDPNGALTDPRAIVLTATTAEKYFGTANPIGRTLTTDRFGEMRVSGVVQDPPTDSHLQFSMLFPFALLEANPRWKEYTDRWRSDGFLTYVLLKRKNLAGQINEQIASLLSAHTGAVQPGLVNVTAQPLRDIHLGSSGISFDRNADKGSGDSLLVLAGIAMLVLIVACINYTNLATARAFRRAREIGMRKVAGANNWQIMAQGLLESSVVAVLSVGAALVLVALLLPRFNEMTGRQLTMSMLLDPAVVLGLCAVTAFTALLAGLSPALFMSRVGLQKLFRSQPLVSGRHVSVRSLLVVVQFALSVTMIIAMLVADRQLDYVRSRDLGFNRDHLLVVDINSGNTRSNAAAIKAALAEVPGVQGVSVSSRVPGEWKDLTELDVVAADGAAPQPTTMNFIGVDPDFLSTYEMSLASGRNFSGAPAETSAVILNETAARALGWTQPLGREIDVPSEHFRARVIGVVKDFNFRSLHESIGPLVLGSWDNPIIAIDYFSVRAVTPDLPATLASIRSIHEHFDQVTPLEVNLLDERIGDFYADDRRLERIFTIAAVLAIVIASLGLLGLLSYITEQRTKEIGIRKVLGASVSGIVVLLSRDFGVIVLVATLIAVPAASLALRAWLDGFAYRIDLSWWFFAFAGGIAMAIALITVSMRTVRAAMGDPVEALRYE